MSSSKIRPDLTIDFEADGTEILRRQLVAAGYAVTADESPDDISLKYFNVRKRQIAARPRVVWLSREFACPPEHQAGLDMVRRKAEMGDNLRPHQSTNLKKADFDDMLLNHWEVHHFHLGTSLRSDGFAQRTGPVLFARVTSGDFFMLDVLEHGTAASKHVWSTLHLVETIHGNWPESIRMYRTEGPAETALTMDEISVLRANGVCPPVTVSDGTVYLSIGGGYATSKDSIDVVAACDRYYGRVKYFENSVRSKLPEMLEKAAGAGIHIDRPLHFRLELGVDGKASAIEVNSRVAFVLGEM